MEYFYTHFAILAGGVIASIAGYIGLSAARERIEENISIRNVREIAQLYSTMQTVINDTPADRFLILMLSNGGRLINITDKKYVTILDEVHNTNAAAIINDYDRFRVDAAYLRMFSMLMQEGQLSTATREIEPSVLRDAYEAAGITHTQLFYIGYKKRRHYFGSISTTSGQPLIDPPTYNRIQIAINNIRRMFRKRGIKH